ncbi:uncharacterized protein JCM6883_001256 [Sporobolomyces salmoneus]|uniref:uncharacterized protein n=1 Tax=Sporobolomyces salmoneus TaxID=183962 RepID=UPI00316CD5A2
MAPRRKGKNKNKDEVTADSEPDRRRSRQDRVIELTPDELKEHGFDTSHLGKILGRGNGPLRDRATRRENGSTGKEMTASLAGFGEISRLYKVEELIEQSAELARRTKSNVDKDLANSFRVLKMVLADYNLELPPDFNNETLRNCLECLERACRQLGGSPEDRKRMSLFPDNFEWNPFLQSFYLNSLIAIFYEAAIIDVRCHRLLRGATEPLHDDTGPVRAYIGEHWLDLAGKETFGLRRQVCSALRDARLVLTEDQYLPDDPKHPIDQVELEVQRQLQTARDAVKYLMKSLDKVFRDFETSHDNLFSRIKKRKPRVLDYPDTHRSRSSSPSPSLAHTPISRRFIEHGPPSVLE